jgi:hypothetical protein
MPIRIFRVSTIGTSTEGRPGLRLLAALPEGVESAAADAKHSSGPRRKSSSLARVKFCIANLDWSVGPRLNLKCTTGLSALPRCDAATLIALARWQ